MKLLLVCIGTASLSAAFTVYGPDRNQDDLATQNAIRKVLSDQSAAWNSGDIPGFMDGYLNSDTLRFASGGSITFGWQPTLERYQKRYTDRDIMGRLDFRDLKILILSDRYAEVFGSWHLTRNEQVGNASGLFTLLMQQTPEGWKVIHDHTSSAEPPPTDKPPGSEQDSTESEHPAGAKKQPQ